MEAAHKTRIESTIKNIQQLPTLPTIYSQLTKTVNDPKSSARRISAIIEDDQALTTKIFKIINSAFYSFPQKITSISHAVVLLGFNEIKHIALAASVIDLFGEQEGSQKFNHEAFWQHSLGVAVCARIIAKKVGPMKIRDPEEAFTAGLMHDIGKIVEDQFMHDFFVKILVDQERKHSLIIESEQAVLGFSHQEVGQFLAEKWNLPPSFVDVIAFHNLPDKYDKDSKTFGLLSVVHLADILTRALKVGYGGDEFTPSLYRDCWDCLGLSKSHVEVIMDETEKGFSEVESALSSEKATK